MEIAEPEMVTLRPLTRTGGVRLGVEVHAMVKLATKLALTQKAQPRT